MRIKKIRIRNFKSIIDSGYINLDQDITVLLGKNEAGKTSILEALEYFDDKGYEEEDLSQDSKAWEKFEYGELEAKDIPITTICFEIEGKDKSKLRNIHPDLNFLKTLECTKFFDNTYKVRSDDVSIEYLKDPKAESNEVKINKSLSKIKEIAESFKGTIDSILEPQFIPYKARFESIIDGFINYNNENVSNIQNNFNAYYEDLRRTPQSNQMKKHIEFFIDEIDSHKLKILENLSETEYDVEESILNILPGLILFSEKIDLLEDSANKDDFLRNKNNYKTLYNLIKLSKINVNKIRDAPGHRVIDETRKASTKVTGLVNKSWEQDKVEIDIDAVGEEIIVLIKDNKTKNLQKPSRRSQGFQWFLSFYINFTADPQGEFKDSIILLDDPGVYLHASGQKDLLNTLEKISKTNQIIFSTHSPFMVDRNNLDRIRIVSKEKIKGTLIKEKFHVSDFDAFEPIRASIGMKLGDSLFATKKNCLVEGRSDWLILEAFSKLASEKGKNSVDTDEISIFPTMGAAKMPIYTTLLTKDKLNFIAILDYDKEGKKVAKQLKNKFGVNKNLILTLDTIFEDNKKEELVIEDLIDFDFYVKALNEAYDDIFKKKRKKSIENLPDETFKGINDYFKAKRLGKLDKILVAKKIYEFILEKKTLPNEESISNFSTLFELVNERIG